MITVMPIMQLILLSYAADNEVRNVKIAIVNQDQSTFARRLVEKVKISDRFILVDVLPTNKLGDDMMQKGLVDVILTIPPQFEKTYFKSKSGELQLLVNAINGSQATVGSSYLAAIIQSFSREIRMDAAPRLVVQKQSAATTLRAEESYWFNPQLNYKYFMAPGIIGELVTILVIMLTAMNIVREKEMGTIEQINVTPIKKWQFILGKLIPFLVIGLVLLVVGLAAGKLIFDIPILGDLRIVFAFCILNLIAVLGLGLFISNLSDTQPQAMFTTFFFVIIFILMSGLFTPIESMPKWAQQLTIPNPIAHFVHVMRSVLLKGSDFADVVYNFRVMGVMAVILNTLAIWSYRKVS